MLFTKRAAKPLQAQEVREAREAQEAADAEEAADCQGLGEFLQDLTGSWGLRG